MSWKYSFNKGTWYIIPKPNGYHLIFDHECFGIYQDPFKAADDVYCQSTGCDEWDSQERHNPPCDLSEWEQC